MKSKIDYGKIIAIGLIAVLTTAIASTSALNTFSEEEDEDDEEKSGKSDKSGSEEEQEQSDEDEQDEQEGTETESEDTEIEIKGEVIGDSTQVKVEIEFTSTTTDKESLLKEIIDKVHLDRDTVSNLLKIETEEEEEKLKEELEVEVEVKEGKAKVDFEFKFAIDSTDTDAIIDAIVGKLAGLTLTLDDIKFKVKGAEEEDKESRAKQEIKVEAKIVGTSSLVEVKLEFTSSNTDKKSLLEEILDKIRLDEEKISNALEIGTEEDEEMKEKLEVKAEIKDGKAEVKFEYKFVIDSTERNTIVFAIVDKLQKLEFEEDDIELKVKEKKEVEVEAKREYKEKAAKRAEEAKERAEAKGKPEFVENIDKAERFFGKTGKAVVGLKMGLESEDIESMNFGSAQLILIKMGDKEPMFRATINVITDRPVDTLTACLDGQSIGQLMIITASEELGITVGHMRESLTGLSVTIPGITVDIVEGTDCKVTPMLSGSI